MTAIPATTDPRRETLTLLAAIFTVAAGGLVYELLIATVSSYLLGNSVTQFSLAIGAFIGAMGLGSHLSQKIPDPLLPWFVGIEIALGAIGGISVALLFAAYAWGWVYHVVLYAVLVVIGTLTGLELPLLTRLLKPYGELKEVLARALSVDYIGALAGSVLFPLVLLPSLGLMRTACLIGLINVGVAMWTANVFRATLGSARQLVGVAIVMAVVLAAGFAYSYRIVTALERRLYDDEVIHTVQTPYQRIVVTRWRDDLRLFLDGHLQFASVDEYRYHESLVHPAMAVPLDPENVLILGGGDGLAVREVLKYPGVRSVTLVDIDAKMTELCRDYPPIARLNERSLHDPRVRIVNEDAFRFLERDDGIYQAIVSDLPDPNTDVLAKLYSVECYKLAKRRLSADGAFVAQSTSPVTARDAFWCIHRTMIEAGFSVAPYHAYVPTFGDWGFMLATHRTLDRSRLRVEVPTRFLTADVIPTLFVMGKDVVEVPVEVSTLDRPRILDYYVDEWRKRH